MSRPWMPLYVADYLADTGHLSAVEHGAYLLLIMNYWKDGGLPSDEGMIRRLAKLDAPQWAESRDVLVSLFSEGWRHKRIDEEIAKAEDIISKRRTAGAQKHSKSSAIADTRAGTPSTIHQHQEDEGSDEPSSSESETAPSAVAHLPTVSDGEVSIFEADVSEWRKAFPAVDVPQQLAAMRSWLIANPTKRKTKRGMRKFVVAWLDRKQNNGTASVHRATSPPQPHQGDGYNAVLNRIINGNSDAEHHTTTVDASYERTDRGGSTNLVQFDAISARNRP